MDNQFIYKTRTGWAIATATSHGEGIYLNDPHTTKLGSIPTIPISKIIGIRVKYGSSIGIIRQCIPTTKSSQLEVYCPYLTTKIKSVNKVDVGVNWINRCKDDQLYYWNDINTLNLEILWKG